METKGLEAGVLGHPESTADMLEVCSVNSFFGQGFVMIIVKLCQALPFGRKPGSRSPGVQGRGGWLHLSSSQSEINPKLATGGPQGALGDEPRTLEGLLLRK